MRKGKQFLGKIKRLAATFMAAAMVMTIAPNAMLLHQEEKIAEAATSGVLSNDDRGVLFANSRSDFRDESIYFVITTRFYDGDSSNNTRTSEDKKAQNPEDDPSWRGDFAGLIEKLDYIQALGFTAVWITPVVENDSGYDYHGYHAYNFNAVDTRYESNGVTYQDLIDAVHAKGMKIIQDVVLNHTCNWGEENLLQITSDIYSERNQAVMNGSNDPDNIYHHNGFCGGGDWDNYSAQNKTIADDCFDLETENPTVYKYLINAYVRYINMGVDAFRVDTVKHISRLTFNSTFLPAFQAAGGSNFYMFGEVCTKGHNVWYRDCPPISTAFYTWADSDAWTSRWSEDLASNESLVEEHYAANMDMSNQPTSNNTFLNGNEYHTPDYSEKSGMDVIDFQMHWSFINANSAFNTALGEDKYFNDSTWNVVYVDSHDYAPDECQTVRYTGGTDAWAENLSLMFTFRGIPCVYYGSEIEFQKGKPIDVGPNAPLSQTGRAYYGDNIKGDLTSTDFTVFGNVNGQVAETLNAPLSQHIMRLNRIRQAIPALRKGQYSTEGCSGNIAFKRRYTDSKTDSFVLVAISGSATFSGIPNGKYVDAVTGDVKTVSNGTLSASVSGQGNMKIYVLDTAKTSAPGRVITNGQYLTDGGAAENIGAVDVKIVEPTKITLSKDSTSIMEGNTENITATIAPADATKKTVTWSTSDASVATVSGGTIKGISTGTAVITAKTSNGLTDTINVTVTVNPNIIKATGITMTTKSLTLTEKETGTLSATILPANTTDKTISWTSSDTAIATVDSTGKVTAVAEGIATITATTVNGLKATALVTVNARDIPVIENGVYFEKPSSWGSNIKAYMFSGSTTVGTAWPGTAMEDLGNGIYGLEYTSTNSNLMIIFNDGSNQTADFKFVNNGLYDSSGFVKVVDAKGKVNVIYQDAKGSVLSSQTLSGEIGTSYTTTAKTIAGYELITTPANASGKYTSETITVTYVYSKVVVDDALKAVMTVNKTSVNVGDSVTLSASASGGSGSYTYKYVVHNLETNSWYTLQDYGSNSSLITRISSAGKKEFVVSVKDVKGTTVTSNKILVNASTTVLAGNLTVNDSASAITANVGTVLTLKANATGGNGKYTYKYVVHNMVTNTWYTLQDYGSNSSYVTKISSTGKKEFVVSVKDGNGTIVTTNKVIVTGVNKALSGALKVNGSTAEQSVNVGTSLTLAASASGGSGSYTYKYVVHNLETNSWYTLKDYSSVSEYTTKISSTGNKEFVVSVKDSNGTIVATNKVIIKVSSNALTGVLKINNSTNTIDANVSDLLILTASASGGSGSYTYKYVVHNLDTNVWYTLKDYGSSNIYITSLSSKGNKEFIVSVKDGNRTIVTTNKIKVVTK